MILHDQFQATNTATNEDFTIDCDMVVMAVGSKKNTLDVEGMNTPIWYVGDCSKKIEPQALLKRYVRAIMQQMKSDA